MCDSETAITKKKPFLVTSIIANEWHERMAHFTFFLLVVNQRMDMKQVQDGETAEREEYIHLCNSANLIIGKKCVY